MRKSNKTQKELETIFTEMDERVNHAENDLEAFRKFIREFKAMDANLKKLTDYYTSGEWLADSEKLDGFKSAGYHYSAGQDPIWNAMDEFHREKIKLLKLLSRNL